MANPLQSTDPVAVALETSMRHEIERIFRLMAIRWPRFDVESAYVGVMADDAGVRANALEFLDAVLKPQVRVLVLPLLDPQVSRAERVRLANEVLGTRVESHEDAVSAADRLVSATMSSAVDRPVRSHSPSLSWPATAFIASLRVWATLSQTRPYSRRSATVTV